MNKARGDECYCISDVFANIGQRIQFYYLSRRLEEKQMYMWVKVEDLGSNSKHKNINIQKHFVSKM